MTSCVGSMPRRSTRFAASIVHLSTALTRLSLALSVNRCRSFLVEGTLRLGMSYLYAPGRTVDLSFGVGLTPDTPNLQFSPGLPFRMSLWGSKPKKLPTK
jgi:hypothetical protein